MPNVSTGNRRKNYIAKGSREVIDVIINAMKIEKITIADMADNLNVSSQTMSNRTEKPEHLRLYEIITAMENAGIDEITIKVTKVSNASTPTRRRNYVVKDSHEVMDVIENAMKIERISLELMAAAWGVTNQTAQKRRENPETLLLSEIITAMEVTGLDEIIIKRK